MQADSANKIRTEPRAVSKVEIIQTVDDLGLRGARPKELIWFSPGAHPADREVSSRWILLKYARAHLDTRREGSFRQGRRVYRRW
jgi:hypothetical protein